MTTRLNEDLETLQAFLKAPDMRVFRRNDGTK
jgi:hypothetical protein